MNLDAIAAEMLDKSRLLDKGVDAMRDYARQLAESENAYRKERARCFATAPEGTVAAVEAWVNGQTADLRMERDLADAMRTAAWEACRARRTQISALQTLASAYRAEVQMGTFGPEVGP